MASLALTIEADLFLNVERGVLVFTQLIQNVPEEEQIDAGQQPQWVEVL